MEPFSDPGSVATYADNAIRRVPGYLDLQRMAMVLLAERVPENGSVLVLGAGGGLELKLFAAEHPAWRFVAVDPSGPMLDMARQTLGNADDRVNFHHGYIDDAPRDLVDGAVCLLTLHFLVKEERLRTLKEMRSRLKPGAPLVVAHHSYPSTEPERGIWLSRFANYGISNGIDPAAAVTTTTALAKNLPALPPEEDEALLVQAGFSEVALFYAALTFRGWVALNG